jgi:hypothetical protein
MVKSDGENQRHYEQKHEDALVTCANNQQEKEANEQDHDLGGDDVGEDGTHKNPVLTFEEREAIGAVMPDVKRSGDDSGFATGGTT